MVHDFFPCVYVSTTYLFSTDIIFMPPFFFSIQHVHTQPMITNRSVIISIPMRAPKAVEMSGEQSSFSVVTSDDCGCTDVQVCNALFIFVSICLVEVVLQGVGVNVLVNVAVSLSIFVVVDKIVLSALWFHTVVVSKFCTIVASLLGIVVVGQS